MKNKINIIQSTFNFAAFTDFFINHQEETCTERITASYLPNGNVYYILKKILNFLQSLFPNFEMYIVWQYINWENVLGPPNINDIENFLF